MGVLQQIHALWRKDLFVSYIGALAFSVVLSFVVALLLLGATIISLIRDISTAPSYVDVVISLLGKVFLFVLIMISLFPLTNLPTVVIAKGISFGKALKDVFRNYIHYFKVLVAGFIFNLVVGLVAGVIGGFISALFSVKYVSIVAILLYIVLTLLVAVVESGALIRMTGAVPKASFGDLMRLAFRTVKEKERIKLSLVAYSLALLVGLVAVIVGLALASLLGQGAGVLAWAVMLLSILVGAYFYLKYIFISGRVWAVKKI